MNDFLVDVVYKNSQKSRYKNGIEEKRLKQQIHGNTGFEKKLITSLSKHEKQRSRLEEEYFYLQNEMHKLGIQRQYRRDNSGDTSRTLSSVTTFKTNQASRLSSSENLKAMNQIDQGKHLKSEYFETTIPENNQTEQFFPPIKNLSRRRMTIADIGNNNANFVANFTKKSNNYTRHKSMEGLSESALNFQTNNDLRGGSIIQSEANINPNSQAIQNIKKKDEFDWLGSASLNFHVPLKKNVPTKLPMISKLQNQQIQKTNSFGQELNQLTDPTSYRHSKPGYERYKSNPHIYLPDGSMRRKFSLPKLSESIEQFKECRYLRRGSLLEPPVTDNEISGIFSFSKPNSLNEDVDSDSDSDGSVNE